MLYDKIQPIEEILHEDEFTGRTEILRELYVKGDTTERYQIDAFASDVGNNIFWMCECKYK